MSDSGSCYFYFFFFNARTIQHQVYIDREGKNYKITVVGGRNMENKKIIPSPMQRQYQHINPGKGYHRAGRARPTKDVQSGLSKTQPLRPTQNPTLSTSLGLRERGRERRMEPLSLLGPPTWPTCIYMLGCRHKRTRI